MQLMTRKQMAEHLGISYQWMGMIARTDGFPSPVTKSSAVKVLDDGTTVTAAKRPSWLYDFEAVSKFLLDAKPLISINAPRRVKGEASREIPCGTCGKLFNQRLPGAHWFCSRSCKEKARRERKSKRAK